MYPPNLIGRTTRRRFEGGGRASKVKGSRSCNYPCLSKRQGGFHSLSEAYLLSSSTSKTYLPPGHFPCSMSTRTSSSTTAGFVGWMKTAATRGRRGLRLSVTG